MHTITYTPPCPDSRKWNEVEEGIPATAPEAYIIEMLSGGGWLRVYPKSQFYLSEAKDHVVRAMRMGLTATVRIREVMD